MGGGLMKGVGLGGSWAHERGGVGLEVGSLKRWSWVGGGLIKGVGLGWR